MTAKLRRTFHCERESWARSPAIISPQRTEFWVESNAKRAKSQDAEKIPVSCVFAVLGVFAFWVGGGADS